MHPLPLIEEMLLWLPASYASFHKVWAFKQGLRVSAGHIEPIKGLMYMIVQLCGGCVGILLVVSIAGRHATLVIVDVL